VWRSRTFEGRLGPDRQVKRPGDPQRFTFFLLLAGENNYTPNPMSSFMCKR
jgi:hypothetical protein